MQPKGFLQLTQQSGQIVYIGHNWTVVPGTGNIATLYMNGGHFTINQAAPDLVNQLNDFFSATVDRAVHKAA
jgi:hypothetical protein